MLNCDKESKLICTKVLLSDEDMEYALGTVPETHEEFIPCCLPSESSIIMKDGREQGDQ